MAKKIRILILLAFDAISMGLACFGGAFISGVGLEALIFNAWYFILIALGTTILFNTCFKLYTELLKYIDFNDALKILLSGFLTIIVFLVSAFVSKTLTVEWAIVASLIYVPLLGMSRFIYRIYSVIVRSAWHNRESKFAKGLWLSAQVTLDQHLFVK